MDRTVLLCVAAFGLLFSSGMTTLTGQGIGVNLGMIADNLPPLDQTVALYRSRGLTKIRIFDANPDVLNALRGSGIKAVIGTPNTDIPMLAANQSFAAWWVQTYALPFADIISYLAVGNEVFLTGPDIAPHIGPAMQNVDAALAAAGVHIPVSTALAPTVLGVSNPPSQGQFSDVSMPSMGPIVQFLKAKQYPLLVNVYSYFAYASSPENVPLDYCLFTSDKVVVRDGQYEYKNMFDAVVDSMYAAMERAGAPNIGIVVSETGWPSGGGTGASVENAQTYNNNAVKHVLKSPGTPRRPGVALETYLFEIFNENLKPEGTERNWGLYYPNKTEVYHVEFS